MKEVIISPGWSSPSQNENQPTGVLFFHETLDLKLYAGKLDYHTQAS